MDANSAEHIEFLKLKYMNFDYMSMINLSQSFTFPTLQNTNDISGRPNNTL